jgi:hypothetical protein
MIRKERKIMKNSENKITDFFLLKYICYRIFIKQEQMNLFCSYFIINFEKREVYDELE